MPVDTDKQFNKLFKKADKVADDLADQGRNIEAGWQALRIICLPPQASQMQVDMMRMSFFLGANHLWGMITGADTAGDVKRLMNELGDELKEFHDQTSELSKEMRSKL